ncbi:MAG: TetR/AcrR family transcriptional regulator [Planctomycetota bacterium]
MPRPVEFDRDVVLEQAMDVFWIKGYEATSLLDLLSAMNLSKSSFYQAFGSKEELFLTCLSHYQEALAHSFEQGIAEAPTALGFLEAYLASIADNRNKDAMKGCLLMNTASEFAERHPEISRATKKGLNLLTRLFSGVIQQGQAEGEISKKADPAALGTFLLTTVAGLKTMAKAGTSKAKLRAVADSALVAVRGA